MTLKKVLCLGVLAAATTSCTTTAASRSVLQELISFISQENRDHLTEEEKRRLEEDLFAVPGDRQIDSLDLFNALAKSFMPWLIFADIPGQQ